jgi:hypothetical protein
VITALTLPGVVHGCSSPTAPPDPPGGGTQIVLSYDEFVQTVSPVLEQNGCSATGDCHGGGIRGTLELSPPNAKNLQFDFEQASLQVSATDRDASPILTEPLAISAGGTPHGVKPFAATTDSGYISIRQWIQDGVVQ